MHKQCARGWHTSHHITAGLMCTQNVRCTSYSEHCTLHCTIATSRNIASLRVVPPVCLRFSAHLPSARIHTRTHTHSLTHIRTHQFRRLVNKNVSKMPSVHYTQANLCAYISAALLLCVCGSTLKRRAALMRPTTISPCAEGHWYSPLCPCACARSPMAA